MRVISSLIIGFSVIIGLWGLGWNVGGRFRLDSWEEMPCVIDTSTGSVYTTDGIFFIKYNELQYEAHATENEPNDPEDVDQNEDHYQEEHGEHGSHEDDGGQEITTNKRFVYRSASPHRPVIRRIGFCITS